MPITIQEIIASDTISQLVDKTNFNFDQLLLNGGGPAGPIGIPGPIGPAGGRGPKGSTWYEDTSVVAPGVTPTVLPPTPTPLSGDFYLQFNGDVWEYVGTVWLQTTINLEGPIGPAGPPGGFGEAFGFSTLSFKNTLYNGQLGTSTTGATADNEGVPSVMIGGMGSNYTGSIPGITLTNAYILPPAIETALQSSVASLLIHQKNSTGRSIIFHGGDADATDYYEQSVIESLSGISIGIDDKLILDVPKTPAAPVASMFDLIGFEVNSPLRSQSYLAGQQIRFVTGDDDVNYGSFHNSNFEIQVGQGRPNSTNKFKVSTLSTGTQTLMEMGGGVTPIATQTTNPGNFQLLSGLTRFVTTTNGAATGEFGVYALGDIVLNAAAAGGNPNTKITMLARTGGVDVKGIGGSISIIQTDTAVTNISNIVIENRSANNLGTGGNINIEGNCAIILKSQTQTVYDAPSIAINVDGGGVPGTYPPHTAFIGDQTWQATLGSFTEPVTNVNRYFSTGGTLDPFLSESIMNQYGNADSILATGSTYSSFISGAGGTKGKMLKIGRSDMGGATVNSLNDTISLSIQDYDSTAVQSPANQFIGISDAQYGGLMHATPQILNRTWTTGQNTTPTTISQVVGYDNYIDVYNATSGWANTSGGNYGWNTACTASMGGGTFFSGNASEILKHPFISFTAAYGLGGGASSNGCNGSTTFTNIYSQDVKFPIPSDNVNTNQPGAKYHVTIKNIGTSFGVRLTMGGPLTPAIFCGTITLKVPIYRMKRATTSGWNSWVYRDIPVEVLQGTDGISTSVAKSDYWNRWTGTLVWNGAVEGFYGGMRKTTTSNASNLINMDIQWGFAIIDPFADSFTGGINYGTQTGTTS
jgi:hypothetical protein|tara:strand:+ start:4821 stop:7424 length:2604 start_codon:yes stop_codon:yes gene_type:complete